MSAPAESRRLAGPDVAALGDALAAALGPTASYGRDVRDQHGVDESFHPPRAPDAVVYPTSTEEAAAIVGVCARHRAPIVPVRRGHLARGPRRRRCSGGVQHRHERDERDPAPVGRRPRRHRPGRRHAQAARRRCCAPEGVFFPVDPGADATLGGMVATGASGTTTVRYGAMRENVLSLTVVTADGEVVRTRSRARKSSAGYDLTRLFIGSEGTLGLICEATLRVQPTPEAMSAAVCAFPTLRGRRRLRARVARRTRSRSRASSCSTRC